MAAKWQATKHPGVRFRLHPTRRHGVGFDRYFSIYFKVNGKRHEEAAGWASEGMTAEKAAGLLAKLKEAQRSGEDAPQTLRERRAVKAAQDEAKREEEERRKREAVTFGAFVEEHYLSTLESKSAGAVRAERALLRLWILPALGALPLRKISALDVERLKKAMLDADKTPRSVEYALAVTRQVYARASDCGLFDGTPPTRKVKPPKRDNRRQRFLTHDEAAELLAALGERSQDAHDVALLSLHTGLRAGEILALCWADVDFSRGTVLVRDPKSRRNRCAFMTEAARAMLERRGSGLPNDPVFKGRSGGRQTAVSRTFDRVVAALRFNEGITDPRQKVVFHTLRHSFASHLVEAGVDLYTVKELLGHGTLAMTERYSHLAPDTLRLAVGKLDESIKRGQEAEAQGKVIPLRGAQGE